MNTKQGKMLMNVFLNFEFGYCPLTCIARKFDHRIGNKYRYCFPWKRENPTYLLNLKESLNIANPLVVSASNVDLPSSNSLFMIRLFLIVDNFGFVLSVVNF